MGMYTEFNIGIALKKDTPYNIIKILEYLLSDKEQEPKLTKHDFFKCRGWRYVLVGDSAYFHGITDSKMEFDDIDEKYHLNVRSSIKNYDLVINKFMDFIYPYIYTDGFLGYVRYEEYDNPTLIYNNNGKIIYIDCDYLINE